MALTARTLNDHERTLEVPGEKVQAILMLMDQVLNTEGDEAQRILMAIRGRRGRKTKLTFGGFRDIVSSDPQGLVPSDSKLIKALQGMDLYEDIGFGPPEEFARLAVLITPDLEVCDTCGRYAVDTRGGKASMLNEGRCPHHGCDGLITPVEQGKPYDPWTHSRPGEFPWAQTHDMSDPAHHWPTRHDAIMADIGNFGGLSDALRDAMVQEGLVVADGEFKGQPDVCQWLLWLNRNGTRRAGSGNFDDVYASLTDLSVLGRRVDGTTLRQYCREAKDFKSMAAPASRSQAPAPAPATIRVNPRNPTLALYQLLQDCFSSSRDLSRWVSTEFPELRGSLPEGSLADVAFEATQAFRRRIGFNNQIFDALLNHASGQRANIEAVRDALVPQGPSPQAIQAFQQLLFLIGGRYADEILSLIRYAPGIQGISHWLPNARQVSAQEFVEGLVAQMASANLFTGGMFDHLEGQRPGRRGDIRRVRHMFHC